MTSFQHIEKAVEKGLKDAVHAYRAQHPDHDIYAIALVPSSLGDWVHGAIATEQGLDKVAESYARDGVPKDVCRNWLRWANPDDGWHQDTASHFEEASKALTAAMEAELLEEFDERISQILIQTLKNLAGQWGEDLILGLTHGEDPQEYIYWAEQVNAPEHFKKMSAEFKAARELEERYDFYGD